MSSRANHGVIPTVDLRSPDAAAVDEALQKAGFLLVTGHGVDPALRADAAGGRPSVLRAARRGQAAVRRADRRAGLARARRRVQRQRRRLRRWGGRSPPDLKESFAIGPATPTGDPAVDAVWFPPNVWPSEVPELRAVAERYLAAMTAVSRDLLSCAPTRLACPPTR